jgi:hypothetical protein
MRDDKDGIVLRGPDDLDVIGPYIRTRRKQAGLTHSGEAAPFLGVGTRLLVQLEAGTRGTRGVSLSKLLSVLQGLGLELVIRPRGRAIPRKPSA